VAAREPPDKAKPEHVVARIVRSLFVIHCAFLAAAGGFLALAELSPYLASLKAEMAKSDTALPLCYLVWVISHGARRLMKAKVAADLKAVREENRRKGKRR